MHKQPILIVTPTAYPLGGVAVWLDYLLSGLSAGEMDVHLAAVDGEYHDAQSYLQRYPFVRAIAVQNPSGTEYGRTRALVKAAQQINASVLVSVNIPDVYRAGRILKSSTHPQLKVVSTVHGLVPQIFWDLHEHADVIDHVIVTNRVTQQMLHALTDIDESRIGYAPYGVVEAHSTRQSEEGNPLRLLYCGRIEESQKRCTDIVKIISELTSRDLNYVLRVAGDGPDKTDFLAALAQVSKPEQVIDLGVLNAEQLNSQAYAESDVLLLTSEWETGPIVAWEAMAAGLAVVTSRYFGLEEENALKHRDNCLIFEIGDTHAAADSVSELTSYTTRQRLVKNGHQLIQRRYSRSQSIAAWQHQFGKLMAEPGNTSLEGLKSNTYRTSGRLEKIVGQQLACHLRRLLNKPAYVASAGDEWPHSFKRADSDFIQLFNSTLKRIENRNDNS